MKEITTMPSSKKVLVTGATGLIGKELLEPLRQAGFDVFAITIDQNSPAIAGVNWLKGNLFDENFIAKIFSQIQPQYLLNMAWCTTGNYQNSNLNFDFVRAGLTLLKYFAQNGGIRAVFAGTCFEYAFKDTPIKETDKIEPHNIYAFCKNNLHEIASQFCKANNISFGYGRIFYVYGRNEHPTRLTASIINALKAGKTVSVNHAQLVKDYMYTKDIAAAFVKFLDAKTEGAVNICTGVSVSLAEYSQTVARLLGKENLLDLKNLPTTQPAIIIGDNSRLTNEVGFIPQYTLQEALKEIIN